MQEEVSKSLKKILTTNLFVEIPEEQIGGDDGLQSVVGLDSVGFLELRVICEDQFGVSISDEDFDAENFRTVNLLSALIVKLKAQQQGRAK
ncbi:acyl carrier protein [Stigmatella aurantiaca]|uniref:Coronafacic acid synthetase, acyl carrier protein n=1 Tax=Stigmatella aurantiaca (strain DW4/3-1) TaxID=378806 RepID=Q08QZ9_STIAD|nr:acyl carrier protein [Stigmatella aurantiaca]ADO70559.1 Coronafacic acid synthetase, acyl carrier protein [Stigmatella aurantiaca DW4/3-1]EAU62902.1 coronafacic acid synthetase, acyl carrier protein component [Stigmatella aurantiaca DW4/3-1]